MNTFDIMYWTNGRRESLEANIAIRNILCVENQSRIETEGMKREKKQLKYIILYLRR